MQKIILTLTAVASIFIMSCNSNSKKQCCIIKKDVVSVKEASQMVESCAIMIDVRTPEELAEIAYDVKNIKNIPLDSLESHLSEIPKGKQIILVCRTDNRSTKAFDFLKEKGYTNMSVMKGGIKVWQDAGFPVITGKTIEKKACCANPNSKNCNPDGTCKKTTTTEDKPCCSGSDKSKCATDKSSSVSSTNTINHLEVYAFHGTRQCETCKHMKAYTKETLDKYFSEQLKNGSIVFSIVDVDDAANEKLAEKFQATGTALMINYVVNGKDHIFDWSDFAFDKANDADKFIPELKAKVEAVLKN